MSLDTLNHAMTLTREYEGILFQGKVIENKDPLNLDRVQVSVPGLYDPGKGDIPWAGPEKHSPFGQGTNWGVHGVPAIGSDVLISLQHGDPHYPMYSSIKRYADPDFPSGTVWGFRDPVNNRLEVNLETKTVKFTTNDNVVFQTDGAGNLSISAPGTITTQSGGKMTLTSGAELEVNASGSMTINAPDLTINAQTTINGDTSTNGNLENNGVDVGSTHLHGGVSRGGSLTDPPVP